MASPSGAPRPSSQASTPLAASGDVLAALARYRDRVVGELRSAVEGQPAGPATLMRYHLGWEDEQAAPIEGRGGKLLRPSLCLLCCEAAGGDWQATLPPAAAPEVIH